LAASAGIGETKVSAGAVPMTPWNGLSGILMSALKWAMFPLVRISLRVEAFK
jgi:hypothetical protein